MSRDPRHRSIHIACTVPDAPDTPVPPTGVDCPLCFGLVGHHAGDEREAIPDCSLCAGRGTVTREIRREFRDAHGSPPSTHPADQEPE